MFSPELRKIVPSDTLLKYIPMYKEMIEQYLDNHEAQQTMIQNANYNYQLHVREREKSEKRANDTKFFLVLALVLISVLISVILAMRLRQLKQQIQLRKYIDVIENLKADRQDEHLSINQEELKKKFLEDLEKIEKEEKPQVSEKILDSDEYRMLRQLIEENRIINEDGMRRIEELVDRVSHQFKTRLQILTNGKMRRPDLEIALLIRCGVTTSEMAIILGLMKNSISSRRSTLAKKILGLDNKTRLLDKLILKI